MGALPPAKTSWEQDERAASGILCAMGSRAAQPALPPSRTVKQEDGGPYRQLLYPAPSGCPRSACCDRSRCDSELKMGTDAEHGWVQLCKARLASAAPFTRNRNARFGADLPVGLPLHAGAVAGNAGAWARAGRALLTAHPDSSSLAGSSGIARGGGGSRPSARSNRGSPPSSVKPRTSANGRPWRPLRSFQGNPSESS